MATTFTLDKIREAAEAKFGATVIEFGPNPGDTVELINPLRLKKAQRDVLSSMSERSEAEDSDMAEIFEDALRAVASSRAAVERLIEAVDHDLPMLKEIFESYGEASQVGEASASQD